MKPIKAVLFDLDDTLYDHQHGSRNGLAAVRDQYACFQQASFEDLERDHDYWLEHFHYRHLNGELTLNEVRIERFHKLLNTYGEAVPRSVAGEAVNLYRDTYLANERCVPGTMALLERLREDGIKIGIVTNSTAAEQLPKLKRMKIDHLIDVLVISSEAGVIKPDPAIFRMTLDQLGCSADEVVMVGDSWSADIAGAQAAGIRAVWINRYGRVCPDASLAREINGLEPVEEIIAILTTGVELEG